MNAVFLVVYGVVLLMGSAMMIVGLVYYRRGGRLVLFLGAAISSLVLSSLTTLAPLADVLSATVRVVFVCSAVIFLGCQSACGFLRNRG
jgi:hypothetical protein